MMPCTLAFQIPRNVNVENKGRGNRWSSAEDVWVKREKIPTLRSLASKQTYDHQCGVIYSQSEDHAAWH